MKLESILDELGKPITRMASKLSDIHDSLKGELTIFRSGQGKRINQIQSPSASKSSGGCQMYRTEDITGLRGKIT